MDTIPEPGMFGGLYVPTAVLARMPDGRIAVQYGRAAIQHGSTYDITDRGRIGVELSWIDDAGPSFHYTIAEWKRARDGSLFRMDWWDGPEPPQFDDPKLLEGT